MYIFNDIELLLQLGKLKILGHILTQCAVTISAIKLGEYSYAKRVAIEEQCKGIHYGHSDDQFPEWNADKRKSLTLGDLDSMYLAKTNSGTLVLSPEDFAVERQAIQFEIPYEQVDQFITRIVKDERIIKLYNLIKVA